MKREVIRILTVFALVLSLFVFTACSENDDTDSDFDKDIKDSVYNKTEEDNKYDEDFKIEEDNKEDNKEDDDKDDDDKDDREEDDDEVISETKAKSLLEEYHDIAESMYFLAFDELDIDSDVINYSKYKINNYEEIMEKYFSKEFAKEFTPALLIKENGEYYLGIGGFVEDYDDLRFEDIEIERDKISCTIVCDVWVPDEKVADDVKSDFVLIKEDGAWKIDEFTSYNDR